MANDIDMWNDIEYFEDIGEQGKSEDLLKCFVARYQEGNIAQADVLKSAFYEKYGYWGNYY